MAVNNDISNIRVHCVEPDLYGSKVGCHFFWDTLYSGNKCLLWMCRRCFTVIMSSPIYNGVDILFYRELSVCHGSVCLSVTLWFQLSNSTIFYPILTKLSENVCLYKMEAEFGNQRNPTRHLGVMAPGFLKIGSQSNFRSLTQIFFIQSSPNFLKCL